MQEYDQIADWYAEARSPEVGLQEVAALAAALAPSATVLDLGCGDGIPISRFLIQSGFALTGLDSSEEMIARYRASFPTVPARSERAQDARFPEASFDAVVAWGVLFHLTDADQQAVLSNVASWLKPGGRFLFTSGDAEGVREGTMNGVSFRYRSLGSRAYRRLLERAGLRLLDEHRDPWDNTVYVARNVSI